MKPKYMSASEVDGNEWRDLCCPKCGCDKIVGDSPDLGVEAKCWECGHDFVITENCWKLVKVFDDVE